MAHFILEYSTNLEGVGFEPVHLLKQLIDAGVSTGVFPRPGCRGRAHPCEHYYIADGQPAFAFVHLQVRMGAGRSAKEKQAALEALVDVLNAELAVLYASRGLAISCELVELPEYKTNINNLRDYMSAD